jgi:hypothetical protein
VRRGLEFERAGSNGEALALYRPCLGQLLFRVHMLGKCYPPANTELLAYRDKIEASLRARGATSDDEIADLATINSLYNEETGSTRLYRELLAAQRPPAILHSRIWKDLVEQRAYDEALSFEDLLESSSDLIGLGPEEDHKTIKNAALYYEALLGVGSLRDASNALARLIDQVHNPQIIDPGQVTAGAYDAVLFDEFLRHACRVNNATAIADVLARATQYLNAEAMEKLRGACLAPAPPAKNDAVKNEEPAAQWDCPKPR